MSPNSVEVTLSVQPTEFTMAQRSSVVLTLTATNKGRRTVDPGLARARLLVDGRESKAWQLAVGNGRRAPEWSALPPGESVSMSWSALGPALFPRVGEFRLELALPTQVLPTIRVTADPD